MNSAGCVNNCDHLMSFTIARNCWQGLHATVCPQPAEADISPNGVDSRFDPERTTGGQFCCAAQRSRATPSAGKANASRLSRPMMRNKLVSRNGKLWNVSAWGSLRLDARGLDHLGPLVDLAGYEFSEFGGCQ